jgi:hypothetical protein
MPNRLALSIGAAAVFVLAADRVTTQTPSTARTPWGDPDLQGTYTNTYENGTPFERPDEFAGRKLEDVKGDELNLDIEIDGALPAHCTRQGPLDRDRRRPEDLDAAVDVLTAAHGGSQPAAALRVP